MAATLIFPMKKTFLSFFLLALALSACEQTTTPITTDTTDGGEESSMDTEDRYTWTKHGLSFVVPNGLVVSDMPYSDFLVLDTVDRTGFEGELLGAITLHPSERNLNAEVDYLKTGGAVDEHEFTQETVDIGENTFTKVTFYSEFGDYMVTEYLLEKNGTLWVVREGTDEKKEKTQTVLETLRF